MTPADLEPAPRDPKKLRTTAFWLVGFMLLGGWLILKAYEKWSIEQAKDDRPAIVHQIRPERSLRVIRQDGSVADLMDLRGKVFVINVIHLGQLDESSKSMKVMKSLAETLTNEADFNLVTLVLNPIAANDVKNILSGAASELEIGLPKWWLATNESETLTTFIRKELKPSVPPEEIDGAWVFDPQIVLVDKNGHIRRAVVPQKNGGRPYVAVFDFDEAAEWDEKGKQTGTDLSNEEQLQVLLKQTVELLLEESYESP